MKGASVCIFLAGNFRSLRWAIKWNPIFQKLTLFSSSRSVVAMPRAIALMRREDNQNIFCVVLNLPVSARTNIGVSWLHWAIGRQKAASICTFPTVHWLREKCTQNTSGTWWFEEPWRRFYSNEVVWSSLAVAVIGMKDRLALNIHSFWQRWRVKINGPFFSRPLWPPCCCWASIFLVVKLFCAPHHQVNLTSIAATHRIIHFWTTKTTNRPLFGR